MRVIPAQNVRSMAQQRHYREARAISDPIGVLARAYRKGDRSAESMTPYEREEVCAWLVTHPRAREDEGTLR